MGLVLLVVGLLVAAGLLFVVVGRRRAAAPPAMPLLYAELLGEQRVGSGRIEVHADAHLLRVTARGEDIHLELEYGEDTLRGQLVFGSLRALLAGPPEPLELALDRGDRVVNVEGLRIPVLLSLASPCDTPFRREVHLLLATDGPGGHEVLEDLTDPEAPELPTIPWTLASAGRFSARELERLEGVEEVELVGPGSLRVRYADGNEGRLQLDNLMPELLAVGPNEGRERLVAHLENLVAARRPSELTADSVMVRVYPGPSPLSLALPNGERLTFASYPVASDLTAVLVQDLPTAMRPLRQAELTAVDPAPSLESALQNVLASLEEIRVVGDRPPYLLRCGGDYENVLPLLPEVWKALGLLLTGPPLVALPARDLCLVTSDEGEFAPALLRARMLELPDLGYPLSDGVYRVIDGTLQRLPE